ncbi:MAG: hypothetical protein HYV63_12995 [Candidatus Schekmanbacteria bacterium]|nr:hypothetical protein [Candidatus Schekmanbacteria bacterium]
MPVVTGIDVLGIQGYVFASNRLRDVLAASWMVDHVVKRDANSLLQWGMTDDRVLLAAGGNAIVELGNLDDARTWTRRYTRWLQDEAPGLEVAVVHRAYDGRSLAWGLKALAVDLARAKLERRPSAPQLGLSVTAACSVTGLPATALDRGELVSRRIARLREQTEQARERWQQFLPGPLDHAPGWTADFPDELDLMGRTRGETSLLGVVHVDGNGVGGAIKAWLDRCLAEEVGDERVRTEYREWSRAIDELGERVLHATIQRVASCIIEEENEHGEKRCVVRGTPYGLGFRLREDATSHASRRVLLPLRPILLGGDDLTFVCDGRIALDLAAAALREFEANQIPHLGQGGGERTLTACAGAALVKAHAPFHRSYALAESLCASGKRARQDVNRQRQADTGCWLDWHAGFTRPAEAVENLRRREYQDGNLTMRPYPLVPFDGREQSWAWLDRELLGPDHSNDGSFRGYREARDDAGKTHFVPNVWSGSRSRVKRLGSLVPDGSDAIQRQVEAWNAIEDGVKLPVRLAAGGFIGQRTPLLDAVELLDFHVRLEPDPSAADRAANAPAAEEAAR